MSAPRVPLSWILILIGIAVVVAAILLTSGPTPVVAPQEGDVPMGAEQTYNNMLLAGPNAVYVDTQRSDTATVIVGTVVLEKNGFVVIHADQDGEPGKIIGNSPAIEGGLYNFEVTVDELLREDRVYYAMLHTDDGDNFFDPTTDQPVTDANGNIILMSFEATPDATPEDSAISL